MAKQKKKEPKKQKNKKKKWWLLLILLFLLLGGGTVGALIGVGIIPLGGGTSLGPLKLTAEQNNTTIRYYFSNAPLPVDIQFSLDNGGTWSKWNRGDPILLNEGESVCVKNNANTLSIGSSDYFRFDMSASSKISASGNVNSMINYSDLTPYCYCNMFKDSNLTTAPELPETALADHCYQGMFQNCALLTTASTLPATELKDCCYNMMFYNCTQLKIRQGNSGNKIFTCPDTNNLDSPVSGMFYNNGGEFTDGTPTAGNTYCWY